MNMDTRFPGDRGGFTLIEVLIASLIAVGLVFVVIKFQSNLSFLQGFTSQKLQARNAPSFGGSPSSVSSVS